MWWDAIKIWHLGVVSEVCGVSVVCSNIYILHLPDLLHFHHQTLEAISQNLYTRTPMSLYRQYRPKTFADVVGQDHIISTLARAVEQDKLAHAYLFAGTRGTGKTSTARILAKILLTHGMKDETLRDQVIAAVDEGNLTDLTEIDAASNTGVDNIRDLIEKIQFTPVAAAAKVYIIDEVHMLSKGAFNALLKTLEEPPSYAYFILATTELHKIPATIQSRCQRFLFRQINESDIAGRLRYISDQESIQVEDAALDAIAHHVQGGMRDAISLLDQLRSLPAITLADVKERVGETGHEYVEQVLGALDSGEREVLLKVVRSLEETGVPLENFLRLLLDAVRQRVHAAVKDKRPTALYEHQLDLLLDAVKDLRGAPVPGLVLESALLSLSTGTIPVASAPIAAAPAPVAIPKAAAAPTPPTTPTTPSTPPVPSGPSSVPPTAPTPLTPPPGPSVPPGPQAASGLSMPSLKQKWPDILEKVEPASARMSLKNGQLHSIEDGVIVIRFTSSFHRDKASSPEGARKAEELLSASFGTPLRIKCVLESDVHAPPPIAEASSVDLAAEVMDVF